MAHRAAALSRGPQGPAHSSVGDEGLGFRVAWTAVAVGERHGVEREPLLAGAVPELQDDVPVPRGKLRTGRGRVGSLYVRRVSVIHPRYSAHQDRKSTRLNSSHSQISYAVFCLKKKKK